MLGPQALRSLANACPDVMKTTSKEKDFPCLNSISMHPPVKWPTC